jgi:hypothetical protein
MCLPPRKNGLRSRQMARVIDIEKRVKRRDRPIGNGARVALQKIPGLAHILLDESMAQIPSDRDRPKRNQRMRSPARTCASGYGVAMCPRIFKADAKIIWQERRIGRRAEREFRIPVMRGDPIESGKNTSEWTLETRHIVGGDGQVFPRAAPDRHWRSERGRRIEAATPRRHGRASSFRQGFVALYRRRPSSAIDRPRERSHKWCRSASKSGSP